MADYVARTWATGDDFTADQATAISQELDEQENYDAFQDANLKALANAGFVYNLTPDNTKRLQYGKSKAIARRGTLDIGIVSDSHTSSLVSPTPADDPVNNFPKMWWYHLRTALANNGFPIAGNFIFANDAPGANDPRYTFSGPWIDGYGFRTTNAAGVARARCIFDTPGTTVAVYYLDAAFIGPFDILIDGVKVQTVTPNDPAGKVSAVFFNGLSDVCHVVDIVGTATTNTPQFLLGAGSWRANGVRILMAAQQGAQLTRDWSVSAFSNFTTRAAATFAIAPTPDLMLVSLGLNDYGAAKRSSAQIISDLTFLRGKFSSSDMMIFADNQPPGSTYAGWNNHIDNLYALSNSLNVPLIDLNKYFGGPTAVNAYGKDGLHYIEAAEAAIRNIVLQAITRY